MKTFKQDFDKLLLKLKNNENFAFSRASDGELIILQNKKLELSERGTFISDQLAGPTYTFEDYKFFDPEQHQDFRKRLWESFQHEQQNYFVGISCPCCVGFNNSQWMKAVSGLDKSLDDPNYQLTWANLFVNANYPRFISEFLPELSKRKIVLICNEHANLENSELQIEKDFRIGRNAMINNIDLHLDISKWIEDNDIKDHVFCFSASSLTNITVHELFMKHPDNTYIDIGTTLNRTFGFPLNRGYLNAFWAGVSHPDLQKVCVW